MTRASQGRAAGAGRGPDDEVLDTAVVGVGHLGRFHAKLMAQVPGVRLAALVDPRPEVGALAAELGVPRLDSIDALPDAVRAVSVAVPTSAHRAVALPLLERGVHVLVEKPMAATVDEAAELAAAAAERGLVLQVGHVERFNPALDVLRSLDVVPRFVVAERLAPFNFRTLDVSVVMDLMIHDIDIVLEIARSPLERLEAVGSPVLSRHVDLANARMTFADGCVANVTASRVSFEPVRKTRVFGEDTFVSLDFAARHAFVVRMAPGFEPGALSADDAARLAAAGSYKEFVRQGLMELEEIDMDEANPLLSEISAFVAAVRGEPSRGVSAAEGLRAMEVARRVSDQIAAARARAP